MNDSTPPPLPNENGRPVVPIAQSRASELQAAVASWQHATTQVQQQHVRLTCEVGRMRRELASKTRELARCRGLAQLGSGCLHAAREIRQQLAPVVSQLSLLEQWLADEPGCREVLQRCAEGLAAVVGTVHELRTVAGDFQLTRQPVCLQQLVQVVHDALLPAAREGNVEIVLDLPADVTVEADGALLRRAVENLVANALDAMPQGGCLHVTAVDCGEVVELEIADSGSGLSDEILRRAFEPYFSTKGDGAGLGLAVVERIAELHGGEVLMMNCPDGGAAFTLRLPRCAAQTTDVELAAAG